MGTKTWKDGKIRYRKKMICRTGKVKNERKCNLPQGFELAEVLVARLADIGLES